MEHPREPEDREFDDVEQGTDRKPAAEKREFADVEQGTDKPARNASAEDVADESDPHVEKQLDHGLKETFPASDPVSINPGAD